MVLLQLMVLVESTVVYQEQILQQLLQMVAAVVVDANIKVQLVVQAVVLEVGMAQLLADI